MAERIQPNQDVERTRQEALERELLQDVAEFVQHNVVAAQEGKKCVDPRRPVEGDNHGMLATAAADMGDVQAFWALNLLNGWGLTPEECFDRVFAAQQQSGVPFTMHTDEDTGIRGSARQPGEKAIGCGAIELATNPDVVSGYMNPASGPVAYADGVIRIIDHAAEQFTRGAYMKVEVLQGPHQETLVVENVGTRASIRQTDLIGVPRAFFLRDKVREQQESPKLGARIGFNAEEQAGFDWLRNAQTAATLENLAYGLPIVRVNADEPELSPVFLGRVQ